ncbi:MAG: hypothetical protein HY906_15335 [Deltaproteobacteria bacterium]|nr:hypothetical protein [Deltaproteobacteria bacterium]
MSNARSRVLLWAGAATVLLASAVSAAPKDPLLRYHPEEGEVDGLTVVEGSHQHGAGDGLTSIYNGGYQRYTRAGVKRASQRYYKLEGQTVELVIHELKSEAAARKLFETSCKDGKAAVEPLKVGKKRARVCAAAADGAAFGYLAFKQYFVASSVDKAADPPARALLQATGDRLAGVKPKATKK